jgi:hypothetical protein
MYWPNIAFKAKLFTLLDNGGTPRTTTYHRKMLWP